MTDERLEVQRMIEADPAAIFRVLCDPQGHVAIDSSGMLMSASGEPVTAVGDTFVVHMDREALNDYPLGRYDVTVTITVLEPDREIAWKVLGQIRPGTTVRSSPRTTTGHRSTRSGGTPGSSRSSPKGRCGPRSGSWPGRWPGAMSAIRPDASDARFCGHREYLEAYNASKARD
jgi:hypothetical protein